MNPRRLVAATVVLLGTAAARPILETPAGTIIGSVVDGVEYYRGIPYAHPPIGPLRLKPPVRLERLGTFNATGFGPSCPQMAFQESPPLFNEVVTNPVVERALFLGAALGNEGEDCLTISIMRPEGTSKDARLPVLFWLHGGGFEIGSSQPYNASVLVPRGVAQGRPFILVSVNYRLGGFGFLGGKELLAEGSTNLGLLDQRMALEWVAHNIAGFGGDPDAVTIWGESAGALSVFDHLTLYDGDNTYNGRPLFRAGIMNSGSILLADPVDGPKAQAVFDTVVEAANCSAHPTLDKVACLRETDYQKFLAATNSVPIFMSYSALALSYMPRPDGKILTASGEALAKAGKIARVPIIVGNMEDEGTISSIFQANITTENMLVSYLNDVIFPGATRKDIAALVSTYPYNNGTVGSPFGTGTMNQAYPQFKRLAAIIGDVFFILMRRAFLDMLPASMPAWSFQAAFERGTPILGTFHTSDLPRIFYGSDDASRAMQDRYIAFVTSLDPNSGISGSAGYRTSWPKWKESQQLLEFGANSTRLIPDDFRVSSFEYIQANLDNLHQ
ncbi:Alpha/Beta hydrolase protein [Colletotrichum navitas]|uniref:Carboxylic ester hydrolase n=1 Tax=Colletotrichum navitas TaxID=681940 RepID=A0AAD8PML3_9PEZI|nr:Alpha/Beta hydrolase protein [Colletotrichum navitas]KAK1572875.1 Alpha/Beta hydrolase protein [Colletotrichum navitas]